MKILQLTVLFCYKIWSQHYMQKATVNSHGNKPLIQIEDKQCRLWLDFKLPFTLFKTAIA